MQRLGRQILEALLFLRERGFPSHGHLHSGNVILQNGVARYVIYDLFLIIFHPCQRHIIIHPMSFQWPKIFASLSTSKIDLWPACPRLFINYRWNSLTYLFYSHVAIATRYWSVYIKRSHKDNYLMWLFISKQSSSTRRTLLIEMRRKHEALHRTARANRTFAAMAERKTHASRVSIPFIIWSFYRCIWIFTIVLYLCVFEFHFKNETESHYACRRKSEHTCSGAAHSWSQLIHLCGCDVKRLNNLAKQMQITIASILNMHFVFRLVYILFFYHSVGSLA